MGAIVQSSNQLLTVVPQQAVRILGLPIQTADNIITDGAGEQGAGLPDVAGTAPLGPTMAVTLPLGMMTATFWITSWSS